MSSYFGFYCLKNLRGIPHENVNRYWEQGRFSRFIPTSLALRLSSPITNPLFKSWIKDSEYLLLIVGREGLEPPMFCLKTFDLQSKPFAATVTYPTLKK